MWWRGHLYVNVREQTLYHLQFVLRYGEGLVFVFIPKMFIQYFLCLNCREKARKKFSEWTIKFEIDFEPIFNSFQFIYLFYWYNCPCTYEVSKHWNFWQKKLIKIRPKVEEKRAPSRFQRCASVFLTFATVSYFLFAMLATRFSVHRWKDGPSESSATKITHWSIGTQQSGQKESHRREKERKKEQSKKAQRILWSMWEENIYGTWLTKNTSTCFKIMTFLRFNDNKNSKKCASTCLFEKYTYFQERLINNLYNLFTHHSHKEVADGIEFHC